MTWRYFPDTDARGNKGFRIETDDVSLVAWVFEGDGAIDAETTARRIVHAMNNGEPTA